MIDKKFFENMGPFSLRELSDLGECEIVFNKNQDPNLYKKIEIEDLASLSEANKNHITFFNNKKYIEDLKRTKAGVCIISSDYIKYLPEDVIALVSINPYKSYAKIASSFYPDNSFIKYIDKTAYIDETAEVGRGCRIEAGVYIGPNVKIGHGCYIGSGSYIGKSVVMGNNVKISHNVTLEYTIMGSRNIIHPGVRIGQDGFGFASDHLGHIKVPQLGRVMIGSDVEIGANTCIDRGTNGDTEIGDQTKIDNLVQIGHNVKIGKGCFIVSQVGISGSSKIGDFTALGGQVGVAGHLMIGSFTQVAAQSGVISNIGDKQIYGGTPSVPIKQWHRQTIALKKMSEKGKVNE